jgi:hypothetical protein
VPSSTFQVGVCLPLKRASIYTCVSSDYRTRTLRTALDATVTAALASTAPPAAPAPTTPTARGSP